MTATMKKPSSKVKIRRTREQRFASVAMESDKVGEGIRRRAMKVK